MSDIFLKWNENKDVMDLEYDINPQFIDISNT